MFSPKKLGNFQEEEEEEDEEGSRKLPYASAVNFDAIWASSLADAGSQQDGEDENDEDYDEVCSKN